MDAFGYIFNLYTPIPNCEGVSCSKPWVSPLYRCFGHSYLSAAMGRVFQKIQVRAKDWHTLGYAVRHMLVVLVGWIEKVTPKICT